MISYDSDDEMSFCLLILDDLYLKDYLSNLTITVILLRVHFYRFTVSEGIIKENKK